MDEDPGRLQIISMDFIFFQDVPGYKFQDVQSVLIPFAQIDGYQAIYHAVNGKSWDCIRFDPVDLPTMKTILSKWYASFLNGKIHPLTQSISIYQLQKVHIYQSDRRGTVQWIPVIIEEVGRTLHFRTAAHNQTIQAVGIQHLRIHGTGDRLISSGSGFSMLGPNRYGC